MLATGGVAAAAADVAARGANDSTPRFRGVTPSIFAASPSFRIGTELNHPYPPAPCRRAE